MTVAEVAGSEKTVAVTSWEVLLDGLKGEDPSTDDDVQQLLGLALAQDEVAFAPLHAEDLVATIPRRIMGLNNLIDGVVRRAKRDEWMTTKGMRATHQRNSYLRYIGFERADGGGTIGMALCVSMDTWAKAGTSPVWLRIWRKQPMDCDELARRLEAEEGWLPCRPEPDWLWVPIELPLGAEYDDVLDSAATDVKRVFDIAAQLVN
ncbi:MAG: hypothetical protein F4155_04535 [Acidimicrobiales bacterium]|nr:hypothetical protein [Acidimicrobiales bacterium]MYH74051.1 hypothetical protein [Acidimicrobiales bacterium]MYK70587.1 hypothetical protein [Acidimicrobiales bacterium]